MASSTAAARVARDRAARVGRRRDLRPRAVPLRRWRACSRRRTRTWRSSSSTTAPSDDTLAVLRGYGSAITVVALRAREGLGPTRDAGLQLAAGEYVVFLDADDLLEPDGIAIQVEYARRNPESGLVFGDGTVFEDPTQAGNRLYPERIEGLLADAGGTYTATCTDCSSPSAARPGAGAAVARGRPRRAGVHHAQRGTGLRLLPAGGTAVPRDRAHGAGRAVLRAEESMSRIHAPGERCSSARERSSSSSAGAGLRAGVGRGVGRRDAAAEA
ncbi:MAG: glycosyltransferase family A protein [Acidimicrobiia bacterium]